MARRNIKIDLRLNEQEMERLRRDVARSGWSREKYLRALIEHSSIREMPSMDLISVLRNLQQINNNMNQAGGPDRQRQRLCRYGGLLGKCRAAEGNHSRTAGGDVRFMAVTSLWRVKGYIGKVLLYAENPDKTASPETIPSPAGVNRDTLEDVIAYAGREEATNQRQLVTGINCNAGTARSEMMAVKKRFRKEDGTIAYHGYQSFREGEVTPEQAHRIGIRLAEELWGGRYQVLVATHLDKASHIHSHFVINTVSFVDGKKFYRSNGDYARMREVSDRLCREYGLSVIRRPEGKGKNYSEWSAEKNGKPTNRSRIRADIDRAIGVSLTENEFFDALEEMGYELKLTAASGKALQCPSLRPQGSERFYHFDRLGEEYTLDAIESRILERIRRQEPFPEEEQRRYRKYRTEHPPHTKAKGIAALYDYYCYEQHILVRFPASAPRLSAAMRQDLRKLDRLDAQTRFLAENQIETAADLDAYRERAGHEITALTAERTDLRNKLKRTVRTGDEAAVMEGKLQIAAISGKIMKLQENLKTCDSAQKRAEEIQAQLEALHDERKEKTDELFGRSSVTGREDEPQRR